MLTILTLLPFVLCMYAGLDITLEIEYIKEGNEKNENELQRKC